MRIGIGVLFFLALATSGHAADIALGEMVDWPIVCGAQAIEPERYAATEFQTLFAGLTGVTLPIVEEAKAGAGAIYIGPDAVARSGRRSRAEKLGEEGLFIRVARDAVLIEGGRPRGTLYGVHEFFEELCGVRFLTFDHTYYPANGAAIAIPLSKRTHEPGFAFRWSYYGESARYPEFAARLHTNTVSDDPKLGGRTGFRLVGHNVAYLVPPATHGETHPEYYALVDGVRTLSMHGGGPQLCVTNPEVLELTVQAVIAEIEKNPDARNINVAQMDNEAYCRCANCAAIDAREESHAGAMLAFVNAVAERVEQTHPEVLIGTYAYQYTRRPPKTIRARDNVMIQLCSIECCDFHAIDDPTCPLNRIFCEDMAGWKQKADNIFIWHYNTNFRGYMLPFPNLRAIGPSVEYFSKNNGRGVFMQAAGNGFSTELSDLRNYVMSRCLWKPGRDSWAEAREFVTLHYAEAAAPILDYLAYYHDRVDAAGVHPTCFPTETSLAIDLQSARTIFAYFQEAMARAQSDAVRARVEKASLCAYRAVLSGASMHLRYADGVCKPDLTGLDGNLLEQYAALCERYGVTMEGETIPTGVYLDQVRSLHAGMRAIRIENELWQVVVVPESNAKIVEMVYKPTGRNLVEAPRAFDRTRSEEWVMQGEGPGGDKLFQYEVVKQDEVSVTLALDMGEDGRIERTITLAGDAVRIATALTASSPRPCAFMAHPEYDAGTGSADPDVVGIYVKNPDWTHANKGWRDATPTDAQAAVVRGAASGGAFAYYNQEAKFGVEQRFDPCAFATLAAWWNPGRRQVNLELNTATLALGPGESTGYSYEVRYLNSPPIKR